MVSKRMRPLVDVIFCVCCDCLKCRAEVGGKFMYLWGMRSKKEAMGELERLKADHSDRCFLAKETTEEILAWKQQSSFKKRKAA